MHEVNIPVLFMHYLALVLVLILGKMVHNRIKRHHIKDPAVLRMTSMIAMLFILFILCTEYDNLSVMFATMQNGPVLKSGTESELLTFNKYLPYSILIWIVTAWVFFRSVYHKNLFLRNFSVVVFIALVVKIFTFDFQTLSQGNRSVLFLLLGTFLILFAFIYPRALKGEPVIPEIKRKSAILHHGHENF